MSASGEPQGPGGPPATHLPAPLLVAAVLTGLEGLVSLGLAVADLLSVSSGQLTMGLTNAVFLLAYGVALVVFGWAMTRGRPWSRSPVLLAQFLTLGLAWNYHREVVALAVAAAVAAVVVLAGVLHPASLEALHRPEHRRG